MRRVLQLAAAFALIAGVLGVSTALILEVREEVLQAQPPEPRVDFQRPDEEEAGLPIREFTLLDPVPASIPERESRGSTTVLTGNGTLNLGEGDAIEVAPIPVPEGSTAQFPRGAEIDGQSVRCVGRCTVEAANRTLRTLPGATFELPAGATPPEGSKLDAGARLDLPAGTEIHLQPIDFSQPTPMPLLPTTRIHLPSDADPLPPAEEASTVELPAQTTIRGAGNRSPTDQDVSDVLDQKQSEDPTSQLLEAQRPDIEITRAPSTIQKGKPFQVAGNVTRPDGTASVDHPVTLYANESKRKPGFEIQIGSIRTDDDGRFAATARIPEDKPTQPYHIVARADPLLERDPPLAQAYSDPVVNVTGQAQLSIEVPDQEGIQVPLVVRAHLTDAHDAPVPNQTVTASIDGTGWIRQGRTDGAGQVTFVSSAGLPSTGTWTVRASFDGTEHIDGARAQAAVEAVQSRIVTDPTLVVPRGTNATLDGRVIHDDEGAGFVEVYAHMGDINTKALTARNGSFRVHLPIPEDMEVGNHTLRLRSAETTATRAVLVTVTGRVQLAADPPEGLPVGGRLPLSVVATTERGARLPDLPIEATVDGARPQRAITDPEGIARVPVPLLEEGPLDLTISTPGTSLFSGTSRTLTLDPGPLEVLGDLTATIGPATNATVRLTAGGTPIRGEQLHLVGAGVDIFGQTDAEGNVRLPLSAPETTEPGTYQARLDLPRYDLVRSVPLTVLDTPRLVVDVVQSGEDGEPIRLEIEAIGHRGPLADVPIQVQAQGAFETSVTGRTGDDGRTTITVPRPDDADGTAELTVRAGRTSESAPALEVASTTVTPSPFPWWTLLGLIPIAGAAFAYVASRRRAVPTHEQLGPTIGLQLDGQPPGGPPVWHPGDPPTLEVSLVDRRGRALPDRTLSVEAPQGTRTISTGPDGTARLRLPTHPTGVHRYRVRFDGDQVHPATEATLELRIVDYREEIDREYQALRDAATDQGLCGPDVTPRELADALGGSAAAVKLARLFERCDYSPRPVDRAHYERFMRAKEAVRPDGGSDA